jgi:ABC-type nitrate/sulfonate/bicarbonate transport system permease component
MDQLFMTLLGAVLPPFTDFINKHVTNSYWRFVISLLVALALGTVLAFLQNDMNAVLSDGTLIFTSSQVVYNLWYGNSDLQNRIRA